MFRRRSRNRSWRRRRRRPDTQHGLAVVEHIRLVPEVTPYEMDLRSHPQGHGGVDHAEETPEARLAVAGGQVGCALRQGVHRRERRAAVHDARGEPPRLRGGRHLYGLQKQLLLEVDGAPDVAGVAGEGIDVPSREWLVVAVRHRGIVGAREDVVDGVGEHAGAAVVAGGRVALLLQYHVERVGDAVAAGGVVEDVAAAERERVDDVRRLAEDCGGEVQGGGGGVLGEGGGDLFDVVADIGGRRGRGEAAEQEEE